MDIKQWILTIDLRDLSIRRISNFMSKIKRNYYFLAIFVDFY